MKRLIKKCEKIGNEWIAYHGTSKSNLPKIMKEGLSSKYDKSNGGFGDSFVYLASDVNLAWSVASAIDDPIVLKVKLNDKNLGEILRNNDEFPFNSFALDIFYKDYGDKYKDIIDSNFTDFYEILDEFEYNGKKREGDEIYNKIEELYFDEAELMVDYISPSQIIEVLE